MKVKQANAGELTNFEVLDFLRTRGASTDPLGCLGAVTPSECKVFEYIVKTAACDQSKEALEEFLRRCEKFKLAKAEKLNIINLRPSSEAEIYAIIYNCDKRLVVDENNGINEVQELMDLVAEVLPPPPEKPEEEAMPEEEAGDEEDAMPEEEAGDEEEAMEG